MDLCSETNWKNGAGGTGHVINCSATELLCPFPDKKIEKTQQNTLPKNPMCPIHGNKAHWELKRWQINLYAVQMCLQ